MRRLVVTENASLDRVVEMLEPWVGTSARRSAI
jgi:hypothetical protein